ncbi:MAG: glycosyltransferase family 4 protein [Opitutaceae bacterium]|nr:glycosyltransferase family 4 protein [Opitutaceae bacterium]
MKTLLLIPELFQSEGGIPRIMRLYLKALCEMDAGDEVRYVALNDSPGTEPREEYYTRDRLQSRAGCGRSKLSFIKTSLRLGRGTDRVICGHLHQLSVARLLQFLHPRLDYYLVAHGIDVWRPYTPLEKHCLRRARRILCISEYTRRQMLRFYPALAPARLLVVPNTMDPSFGPSVSAGDRANLGGLSPRILVVSRLTAADRYKGVDTVIEAMPLVRSEFPRAQLRIVGGGDDRPRLQDLAQAFQVGDAVCFLGIIDDDALRAEYAACDVFALPSRKEGFGLVYLEAMAYGKPCLGARAGGVPEVIHEGIGALVEYGNIGQIAAALSHLLCHPCAPAVVRQHAETFAFPAFKRRLANALHS